MTELPIADYLSTETMRTIPYLSIIVLLWLASCETFTEDAPQIFVKADYPTELSVGDTSSLKFYVSSTLNLRQIDLKQIRSDSDTIYLSRFPLAALNYNLDSFNINYLYKPVHPGLKRFELFVESGNAVYKTSFPFQITVNP
jgi:hypothetical protein